MSVADTGILLSEIERDDSDALYGLLSASAGASRARRGVGPSQSSLVAAKSNEMVAPHIEHGSYPGPVAAWLAPGLRLRTADVAGAARVDARRAK